MRKEEKGITLVALIITIVVMLILVAVSVNVIVNSDLIGHAEKTGNAYSNAVAKEEEYHPTIGNWKTMDDYMKNAGIVEEKHNWQYTDETRAAINCKCDLCKNHENGDSSNGLTLQIGQEISYIAKGGKITASEDTKYASIKTMTDGGLLIAENEETKPYSTSAVSGTESGTGEDQTIIQTTTPKWVVFGFEDRNKNGTNETLLLTTKPSDQAVKLKGAEGYNNCIEILNRVCRELYGEDARSITIEDVNRATGYDAPATYRVSSSNSWSYIIEYNTQYKDGKFCTPAHPEGIQDGGAELGNYEVNGYEYNGIFVPEKIENIVFGPTNGNYYWLASCGVGEGDGAYFGFGLGNVNYGSVRSCYSLFYSNGSSDEAGLSVRALVSLTSEIPATGPVIIEEGGQSSIPS